MIQELDKIYFLLKELGSEETILILNDKFKIVENSKFESVDFKTSDFYFKSNSRNSKNPVVQNSKFLYLHKKPISNSESEKLSVFEVVNVSKNLLYIKAKSVLKRARISQQL